MSRQSLVSRFHTARRITAATLTLLLLVQTTGCVTWQPQTNPIPSLRNAKPTDRYRVNLTGGRVLLLTNVRIQGDSVFGTTLPVVTRNGTARDSVALVGVPWSQVRGAERRSDQTVAVLLASVVVIGLMSALAMKDFMSGPLLGDNWRW